MADLGPEGGGLMGRAGSAVARPGPGAGTAGVLAVVCLLLAATAGYAWWRAQHAVGTPDRAAVTSLEARDSGQEAAGELTELVLSYAWGTFDSDVQEAEAELAPSFRAEYGRAMAAAEEETLANEVTVSATAVATSVVSAAPKKVVSLVFVDQATTARGVTGQRVDQVRVLVTVTRDGGEWRMSGMRTF